MSDLRLSIARDLRAIGELYIDLHWQVRASTNDADFPGGRALNMMAPAATEQDWQKQYEIAEAAIWNSDRPWTAFEDYIDDQLDIDVHPVNVLGSWALLIREERNQPTDLRQTLSRSMDYIAGSLDWLLSTDEYGDAVFLAVTEVAADLAKVRRAMENVLKSGKRAERVRVTCTNEKCERKPRLIKDYGAQARWDVHRCPACKTRYNEQQFRLARADNLASKGTEKFVNIALAKSAVYADRRTFWSWMDRMQTRAVCDIKTRQIMVWWPSVHELDEAKTKRKAEAKLRKARRSA